MPCLLSTNLDTGSKTKTCNVDSAQVRKANYLSNIVDPEESVSDEQGLHGPELMCSLDMPWTIEGPGRVPSHHVIERLQSLSLLCSLGVLQSDQLLP